MGHTPIPLPPAPRQRTRLDALTDLYVTGRITVEQFEEHVWLLLKRGIENDLYVPTLSAPRRWSGVGRIAEFTPPGFGGVRSPPLPPPGYR